MVLIYMDFQENICYDQRTVWCYISVKQISTENKMYNMYSNLLKYVCQY